MKKVVPKLFVISSQILIVTSFFMVTLNSKNEINFKVNSNEIERLSQFIYYEEDNFNYNVKEEININNDNVIVEKSDNQVIETIKDNVVSKTDKFFIDKEVISSFTGILTGYGPDCVGCGNFKTNKVSTASGYHIANIVDGVVQPAFTVTYNDAEFGEVRVVAGDSTLPFNTIVRITIPNKEPIMAIVLDRGSTVGFENCRSPKGCLTNFDLLYSSEKESLGKTYDVKFEILRMGA